MIEVLKSGSDVEKGTCADVMKHVSKDKSEILVAYIDEIIGYINYKAPRVKMGSAGVNRESSTGISSRS